MGAYDAVIDEDAADFLADAAGGDARAALNAVELGILTTDRGADGRFTLIWPQPRSVFRAGSGV